MENGDGERDGEETGRPVHSRGRIYFSKRAERRFFFFLTLLLLAWGLLVKLGILGPS